MNSAISCSGIVIFDSNRSLGIKNVIFSGRLFDGNILRSITKLKWLAFCISLMATTRSSFVEKLSATNVDNIRLIINRIKYLWYLEIIQSSLHHLKNTFLQSLTVLIKSSLGSNSRILVFRQKNSLAVVRSL